MINLCHKRGFSGFKTYLWIHSCKRSQFHLCTGSSPLRMRASLRNMPNVRALARWLATLASHNPLAGRFEAVGGSARSGYRCVFCVLEFRVEDTQDIILDARLGHRAGVATGSTPARCSKKDVSFTYTATCCRSGLWLTLVRSWWISHGMRMQ
jgi:hypothetical protein